ncbi:MAG: hypothetical protein ABS77_01160 [Phenylobacterium sp. SCN 69-14]|nr:MAG: hypothetical protein ABS77_01160 [Phenylobacterium sp. SCN 69-14]
MKRAGEEGVALLTVLLLVAVMSALAVGLLDDVRFGIRRTANGEAVSQARWYALGAEAMARARLADLAANAPLAGDWNGKTFRFPLDDGVIQGRISDGAACFNLNSVVDGAGETFRRRDLGTAQFTALLIALQVAPQQAEALAGALVDWIDSDALREPGGAEDETYQRGARPYRTAGTLLSEVSELRAVRGFDAALYARLRPHVCALPTPILSPININVLSERHAPLLVMLTDGAITIEAARRAIAARPPQGWPDIASFWRLPALAKALPADDAVNQVVVRPRFFTLESEVSHRDAIVVSTSLFEQDAAGKIRLAARRWTIEE